MESRQIRKEIRFNFKKSHEDYQINDQRVNAILIQMKEDCYRLE